MQKQDLSEPSTAYVASTDVGGDHGEVPRVGPGAAIRAEAAWTNAVGASVLAALAVLVVAAAFLRTVEPGQASGTYVAAIAIVGFSALASITAVAVGFKRYLGEVVAYGLAEVDEKP